MKVKVWKLENHLGPTHFCKSLLNEVKKKKRYLLWIVVKKLFSLNRLYLIKTAINKEDSQQEWLHMSPGIRNEESHSSPHDGEVLLLIHVDWFSQELKLNLKYHKSLAASVASFQLCSQCFFLLRSLCVECSAWSDRRMQQWRARLFYTQL